VTACTGKMSVLDWCKFANHHKSGRPQQNWWLTQLNAKRSQGRYLKIIDAIQHLTIFNILLRFNEFVKRNFHFVIVNLTVKLKINAISAVTGYFQHDIQQAVAA
jgi:hypothetical protein